jgi:hypothetical protein
MRPAGSLYHREGAHSLIGIGLTWTGLLGSLTCAAYSNPHWAHAGPVWLVATLPGLVLLGSGMVLLAEVERDLRRFWSIRPRPDAEFTRAVSAALAEGERPEAKEAA